KLVLQNSSFRFLEQSFKEWLDIQGFADTTVYNLPTHIRELLHYLESQGINHIKELEIKHINAHYDKLKERTHQRRSGGLSNGHLNKHIQALRKFTDYLRKVGRIQLPSLKLDNEDEGHKITFLTEEEIKELFESGYRTGERKPNVPEIVLAAIQARDRAMLAIYYGCGLRRNEGIHLNLSDINFDKSFLHVRKGKNYKERFVPISKSSLKYLQEYIYDHRSQLAKSSTIDALFLGYRGMRMQGQSLFIRLKLLQQRSGNLNLLAKEVGLHTLRHSIATHLMMAGMKIESISRFLGHNSLESTQIYTHLAGLEVEKEQPFSNIPKYEIGKLSEDE
ncbi:MAG: tyrosine-type recombinase/integrase, partial [Cytophagales bacterium]|nr:tyrosine-type recombinase/integrase [Cytophagales bacterium]